LVEGRGKRAFVDPDDPRHPRHRRRPSGQAVDEKNVGSEPQAAGWDAARVNKSA
jgi:hypothetical protein